MLSERRRRVLAALIQEYVAAAAPIGSNALKNRHGLDVSSATIRNELSYLESEGYLMQPHTSAGRVPTDHGYRAFVDDLLDNELADEGSADPEALRALLDSARELDELYERTSAALARMTDCLSVVLPPSALSLHIMQISFVRLAEARLSVVVVTESGQVLNRVAEVDRSTPDEAISKAQELLNRLFARKTFAQMRDSFDRRALEAFSDPLVVFLADEVFACLRENDNGRLHRLGLPSLLSMPEFRDASSAVPVMRVVEDDTALTEVLEAAENDGGGTMVRIGGENRADGMRDVSLVAASYAHGDGEGVVAVIGPTRMDYRHVINAVRAARTLLQDNT